MTLLLLEALGALLLFIFIVWWTMFAGRKRGEPADKERSAPQTDAHAASSSTTHAPQSAEPPR